MGFDVMTFRWNVITGDIGFPFFDQLIVVTSPVYILLCPVRYKIFVGEENIQNLIPSLRDGMFCSIIKDLKSHP